MKDNQAASGKPLKFLNRNHATAKNETTSSVLANDFASLSFYSHVAQCSVSFCDSYSDGGLSKKKKNTVHCAGSTAHDTDRRRRIAKPLQRKLTSIVVTMSVLFASVSETLISRLVEFMAKVLLEYQIPI